MTSSDATTLLRDRERQPAPKPHHDDHDRTGPAPAAARAPREAPPETPAPGTSDSDGEPRTRQMLGRFRAQRQRQPVRVAAPLSHDRILDATEACLREHGYDGTTIRQIAGRLGCAVGTIYRHFTDKRALLDAVTQRRFAPVAERVENSARIQETATLYLNTASAEPQQYRLMFWLASVDRREMPGVPEVIQRIIAGWGHQLNDPARAERFWAQLHGALMLGRNPRPDLIHADALPAAPAQTSAAATPGAARNEDMTLL